MNNALHVIIFVHMYLSLLYFYVNIVSIIAYIKLCLWGEANSPHIFYSD